MDKVQKIREELERLKEETSIGLSEYENGVEQGRMEIINALSILLDSMQEDPVELKEVDSMIHKRERIEVIIITTISGLEATYKHFKNKYPVGTHGSVVYSSIPAVKHMVETYLVELNKEIQIENLKEEIKNL